jgi:hypothetical protein
VVVDGKIIASEHHRGGASLYSKVMTKQTSATDVTLSPSLAEFFLELVDSYIILLLQAKHHEIPLLCAFSCESANSDKRAVHRKPSGTKTCAEASF